MEYWSQELMKITGGIIVGWFAHRFVIQREASNRRRNFRTYIEVLIARLRDTQDDDLAEFHHETRGALRDECAKVRVDISPRNREIFISAAERYCGLSTINIVQDPLADAIERRTGQRLATPYAQFPGRAIMEESLRELSTSGI